MFEQIFVRYLFLASIFRIRSMERIHFQLFFLTPLFSFLFILFILPMPIIHRKRFLTMHQRTNAEGFSRFSVLSMVK